MITKQQFYIALGCLQAVQEATQLQQRKLELMRELLGQELYEKIDDLGYAVPMDENLEKMLRERLAKKGEDIEA